MTVAAGRWSWPQAGWLLQEQMRAIPARETSDPAVLCVQPVVSVIMLAYNHGAYLEDAVDSVLRQKLDGPFEILIGDDHSSDNTLALALALQRRAPAVLRVIDADLNVGIRSNFLRLLVRARAPAVAILEGDDYWLADNKLALQLARLAADPGLSCVAGITLNRTLFLPGGGRNSFGLVDLLRRYVVHSSALMFRRELAIPYPAFPEGALDTMLLAVLGAKGDCGMIPVPLSYYRRHAGGFWTGAHREQRLRLSQECIDAIDAFFFGRFRRELIDREFWIVRLDWLWPEQGAWVHWCTSWRLLLAQVPRFWRRSPWRTALLALWMLWQPLGWLQGRLRRRLALGRLFKAPRSERASGTNPVDDAGVVAPIAAGPRFARHAPHHREPG
jgi:glycosyltransferase involved in cell wall biosynthesis